MGGILSIIIGAVIGFILLLIKIALWFFTHLDVTNSLMVSGFVQMLLVNKPINSNVRIAMYIVCFAVFLIIQNVSKIGKLIFSLISAFVVAAFAFVWKKYDTVLEQRLITLLWFGIGLLLNWIYGAQGITKKEVA